MVLYVYEQLSVYNKFLLALDSLQIQFGRKKSSENFKPNYKKVLKVSCVYSNLTTQKPTLFSE